MSAHCMKRADGSFWRWSLRWDACTNCGSTELRHKGHGLCSRCYAKAYGATPRRKEVLARANRKYLASANGKKVRAAYNRHWLEQPGNRERNRRAARMSREPKHTQSTGIPLGYEPLVLSVFGHRCAACGADARLELDHHRPLHLEYPLLHNAVPLCISCNRRKGSLRPEEFYSPWKLAEIAVLLFEVRIRFDQTWGEEEA